MRRASEVSEVGTTMYRELVVVRLSMQHFNFIVHIINGIALTKVLHFGPTVNRKR